MFSLKERMTSLWPRCGKQFHPIIRGYRAVTSLWHRGTEETSCQTLSALFLVVAPWLTSLAAFAREVKGWSWDQDTRVGFTASLFSWTLGWHLFSQGEIRYLWAPVNTGTRCSVWPGEITEMLHIRQLELLQMCDCSAADWKNAQFHNKVSQKCRAFGQFYPAVACSRDSILWWLGAEPPCVSGLVFILCGLHIHKCTQMEEDLLSFPTWQL